MDKAICTLFSEIGQAADHSLTNIVVRVPQQFDNPRNCWPDPLLQLRWEAASERQRLQVDKEIHTLCSETAQAADRSLTNITIRILQQFDNPRNCWPDLVLELRWEADSGEQRAPGVQGNMYLVLRDWTGS
jgi:hypothetical protein